MSDSDDDVALSPEQKAEKMSAAVGQVTNYIAVLGTYRHTHGQTYRQSGSYKLHSMETNDLNILDFWFIEKSSCAEVNWCLNRSVNFSLSSIENCSSDFLSICIKPNPVSFSFD